MTDDSHPAHAARPAHVGADALADLQEGLLDADGEAAVRRHLESCPACRDDLAALTAVPALLAASGDVGPVPPDVVARLDSRLSAAADAPATTSAASRTVTPLRAERATPRGLRLLQAAAVVVVLLGLGALAVSALPHGGSSGTSSGGVAAPSAGGKGAADDSYSLSASGRNWTATSLAGAVPSLLAGRLAPVTTYESGSSPGASGSSSGGSSSGGDVASRAPFAGAPAARLAGGPALAGCIASLGGAPRPLAVDLARFQGQPAAVIVLPDTSDPTRVELWVVQPTCSQADTKLLYFASVPRS